MIYCKHCKSKTEDIDARVEKCAGRYFLKAVCAVCSMKKAARIAAPKKDSSDTEPEVITEETETASVQ